MKYITTLDDKEYQIEIIDDQHVSINGRIQEVDLVSIGDQPLYSLIVDGRSYESYVYETEEGWHLQTRGRQYNLTVEDELEKILRTASGNGVAQTGEYHLKAPMPGLVVSLPVCEGNQVEKGQVVIVLESMKMQNELKSPRAGTVGRVRVKEGEIVEQRQALLSIL